MTDRARSQRIVAFFLLAVAAIGVALLGPMVLDAVHQLQEVKAATSP